MSSISPSSFLEIRIKSIFKCESSLSGCVWSDKKITVKEEETIKFPGKGMVERGDLADLLKSLNKFDSFVDLDVHGLKQVFFWHWLNQDERLEMIHGII